MIKRIIKTLLSVTLAVAVTFGSTAAQPASVSAASFSQINRSSVFLKQPSGGLCTLTSAVMLVRRAAMLNGNANWENTTVDSMRTTAWEEGAGLKWTFQYAGITVGHADFDGTQETLAALLEKHPEGIVIYDKSRPHAILVTDYTNGVFYAADPANNIAPGRISIDQASISIEGARYIWYVTRPTLYLSNTDDITIGCDENADEGLKPVATPNVTTAPKSTAKPSVTPAATAKPTAKPVKEPALDTSESVTALKVKNPGKKTLTSSWKKIKGAHGYQVLYSTSKRFSKSKVVTTADEGKTIKGLKKGKTYYVKVRAYSVSGKKTNFSQYSHVKKAKIKK